ncbi:cuticular protein 51A [Lycorma delicatula]|uniref:cuticular protein 51A n=1 Tax=Lycorma delicatula TaxID=130591 RepID=UPI003F513861
MGKIFFLVLLIVQTQGYPKKELKIRQDLQNSARNARYYFSTDVDDQVSNLKSHRDELRFGVEVFGSFSYNDGFVLREVIYTADQNGYRVISDKMAHIPQKSEHNKVPSSRNPSDDKSKFQLQPHRLLQLTKTKV